MNDAVTKEQVSQDRILRDDELDAVSAGNAVSSTPVPMSVALSTVSKGLRTEVKDSHDRY